MAFQTSEAVLLWKPPLTYPPPPRLHPEIVPPSNALLSYTQKSKDEETCSVYSLASAHKRRHRVGQVVHIGQSFKASKTSKPTLKKRPAPSKAPEQKTTISTSQVHKENAMAPENVSHAFNANGKFSWSKTLGPWALAIACSAQTGGQFHSAQPYAPST